MSISISATITMHGGEKPQFCFKADLPTHFATFEVTMTAKDGTTVIVPSCDVHLAEMLKAEMRHV